MPGSLLKCARSCGAPQYASKLISSRNLALKDSKNNTDIPTKAIEQTQKIIEYLEKCEKCKQNEKGFISENTDSVWLSKYGVCLNFAEIYEFLFTM